MIEDYKSVQEIADEWGLTERQVQNLCASGKIKGAFKFGKSWVIPGDVTKPEDGRLKSGNYKNWRNKELS